MYMKLNPHGGESIRRPFITLESASTASGKTHGIYKPENTMQSLFSVFVLALRIETLTI